MSDFDKNLAKSWGVEANPCFIVFDPVGHELVRFTAKPDPAQFVGKITGPILSAMQEADKKGDLGALSDGATLLADFFGATPAGREACRLLEDRKKDARLVEACAAARLARKRALDLARAGLLMRQNKMPEYEAALRRVVADYPGTGEAEIATEDLKQFDMTPRK